METSRGRARFKAKFFKGIDPRVISAEHAWWFPERDDPMGAWNECNINMVTDNSFENCDAKMGATHVRSLLCKVYPERKAHGKI